MILLCTILKVGNGKAFFGPRHRSTDGDWRGVGEHTRHNRAIRQILDIRMKCPAEHRWIAGRCRKILGE